MNNYRRVNTFFILELIWYKNQIFCKELERRDDETTTRRRLWMCDARVRWSRRTKRSRTPGKLQRFRCLSGFRKTLGTWLKFLRVSDFNGFDGSNFPAGTPIKGDCGTVVAAAVGWFPCLSIILGPWSSCTCVAQSNLSNLPCLSCCANLQTYKLIPFASTWQGENTKCPTFLFTKCLYFNFWLQNCVISSTWLPVESFCRCRTSRSCLGLQIESSMCVRQAKKLSEAKTELSTAHCRSHNVMTRNA